MRNDRIARPQRKDLILAQQAGLVADHAQRLFIGQNCYVDAEGVYRREPYQPSNFAWIKNTTGATVDQFGILGIDQDAFVIDPATKFNGWKARIALVGVTPDIDVHQQAFAVVQTKAPANAIVRAIVSGATHVKINVTDAAIMRAGVTDASTLKLVTNSDGLARILSKQSGTGDKWAVVALDGGTSGGTSLEWYSLVDPLACGGTATAQKVTWDGETRSLSETEVEIHDYFYQHFAVEHETLQCITNTFGEVEVRSRGATFHLAQLTEDLTESTGYAPAEISVDDYSGTTQTVTITVYDHFLETGDSIPSGTQIGVTYDMFLNEWVATEAPCS